MQQKQNSRRYSAGKVSVGWIVTLVIAALLLAYVGYGVLLFLGGFGHV